MKKEIKKIKKHLFLGGGLFIIMALSFVYKVEADLFDIDKLQIGRYKVTIQGKPMEPIFYEIDSNCKLEAYETLGSALILTAQIKIPSSKTKRNCNEIGSLNVNKDEKFITYKLFTPEKVNSYNYSEYKHAIEEHTCFDSQEEFYNQCISFFKTCSSEDFENEGEKIEKACGKQEER